MTELQLPVRKRGDGTRFVGITYEQTVELGVRIGDVLLVRHRGGLLRAALCVGATDGKMFVHVHLGVPNRAHAVRVRAARSAP